MIPNQQEMTVCEIVKAALKEKGVKQKQLAEMIGKSAGSLSTQLNAGYMSAEEWRKMAELLGYKVVMVESYVSLTNASNLSQESRLMILERIDELDRLKASFTDKDVIDAIEKRKRELREQMTGR